MWTHIVFSLVLIGFSSENEKPTLKVLNSRVGHQHQYGAPPPPPIPATAPAPSYGAPPPPSYPAPAPDVVDLHNKEFCVDVSSYQPVVWEERDGEVCHTLFVKKCAEKKENVCADVTE